MMKFSKLLFTIFVFLCFNFSAKSQSSSESRSVEAYVITNKAAPSITLHWAKTADAVSYSIYKRELGTSNWGAALTTINAGGDTFYTDNTINKGEVYEYSIQKLTSTKDKLASSGNISGYAYISAAIEKPAKHTKGIILVLTSKLIQDSLASDISLLLSDLSNDGWEVEHEVINPTATVQIVKSLIQSKKDAKGCDAVYLVGNIPVPYSGTFCTDNAYLYPPDGHTATAPPSHCGAWPADVFYGTYNGDWTDTKTDSTGDRAENKNIPGDGKFDNIRIPGTVTVGIGRADFSKLSEFSESEVMLTKRYLDKVHSYKTGQTEVVRKGVIENNFDGFAEGFSSGAIANVSAICGKGSVKNEDLFTATKDADYLFSYTCGGGWYSTCDGVGSTKDYKTKNGAAFNHIFGSYFGDFDIDNNIMRASMASSKLGLVSIWSGRPRWVWHTLALGDNYADITIKSQNNWQDYNANYYQNGVHMNLLGDPSLRIDMLKTPSSLVLASEDGDTKVGLSWTASTESDLIGYYVYRSNKELGTYELLTPTPVLNTTHTDENPKGGLNYYMVRAVKETITGSGSYLNLSLGTKNSISRTANIISPIKPEMKIYPTLTTGGLTLESNSNEPMNYSIINSLGAELMTGKTEGNKSRLDASNLESGIYFILINGSSLRFIKH